METHATRYVAHRSPVSCSAAVARGRVRRAPWLVWLALVAWGTGCPSPDDPTVATEDGSTTDGTSTSGPEPTSGTESSSTTADPDGSSGAVPDPVCGNGIVEDGEDCDDDGESATCNAECTAASCGDGVFNATAGEECDGSELGDGTCEGLGFDVGDLACGAGCVYDPSGCYVLPDAPALQLDLQQVKRFDFSWAAVAGADFYQLVESPAPGEPFGQLGGDIVGESVSLEVPLHLRWGASYVLRACNGGGCTDSAALDVMGSLEPAVGYGKAESPAASDQFGHRVALSGDGSTLAVGAFSEGNDSGAVYVFVRDGLGTWSQQAYVKASNPGPQDWFGCSVALSTDGSTLAVGARTEDSGATGVGGNQADESAYNSGAAYVFVRDGMGGWSQQAYVKASNTGAQDLFGHSVALGGDGNTLAVGALQERSVATGVGGNEADDSAVNAGAVYVFARDGMGTWSQQAYVKASNTDADDMFGHGVALDVDGSTLAVAAYGEDSAASGIDGDQGNGSLLTGAVYVFVRDGMGAWSQQAYVKPSVTGSGDSFGYGGVTLSMDGSTLAVATTREDSSATGVGGDQADDAALDSGAAYVFVRDGVGAWSEQAYLKASNTASLDYFGHSVSLNGDGDVLAVGAVAEDSSATGVGGNEADGSAPSSGAVYVFVRDGMGAWSHRAYVKASNTDTNDGFGQSVALSDDGNTLAVGAHLEDGSATGIGGDQADDAVADAGAVYLY